MLALPTSLSLVNSLVRWFRPLFSLVPVVGLQWAHNRYKLKCNPGPGGFVLSQLQRKLLSVENPIVKVINVLF